MWTYTWAPLLPELLGIVTDSLMFPISEGEQEQYIQEQYISILYILQRVNSKHY